MLPTYNEIDNIEPMLRALRASVPDADILVVDDASPDNTAEAAEKLAPELGAITVLHREGKGGLGSAYRFGFAWGLKAGYDALVEIDCDFSHDPAALPGMLKLAENYEVVIGSRYVAGGSIPVWSWSRRTLSRGGNRYASAMLGLHVADSTAGYRVYRASALDKMHYETVTADGYGFQVLMTYRARRTHASLIETPIAFVDRTKGQSKMSTWIVAEALWLVTKLGVLRLLGRGDLA